MWSAILPGTALVLAGLAWSAAAWQPQEFPISYWFGPPAAHNTLATWQRVRECNFTVCGPAGGYSVEENRKMLDFCAQLGLKAMVLDGRISWRLVYEDNWQQRVAQIVGDYAQHPALYGYFLYDEPNYELFVPLGELSREFQRQDPSHLPYINLFPTYATVQQLGTPTYADYLDKYLSIVKPVVLSYDHYCLLQGGQDRPDYFENLELIREYGLRYGVPPWNIILALPHFGYREPSAGDMRWQVYTSLAYGMKGIMYFTYWTDPSWEKEGHLAIVDSQGQPTRLYPIVQQLNAEMRALGPTLLGLTSTGVYHTGPLPPGCRRLGSDALLSLPAELPLVAGFFRDAEGRDYVMVVNRDHDHPVEFAMALKPHVVAVTEVPARGGGEVPLQVQDGRVSLRLEAGEGRLFRLATQFNYPQPPQPCTEINFQFDRDGDLEGWGGFNALSEPRVAGGVLTLTFTGPDPYMVRDFLRLPPDRYSKIRVRMRLPKCQPTAQCFWTTTDEPQFADDKHIDFPVVADGQWHEYEVPVGDHERWRGKTIRALRLDPTVGGAEPGSKVEIDWIVGE
jgi:hypothetical protein